MELSAKGVEALRHAEEILVKIECLTALSKPSATIRIGVNISPQFLQLSQLTQLLQERFPAKKILFTDSTSRSLMRQLEDRDLDLCLAFGPIPDHFRRQEVRKVFLPLMVPVSFGSKLELQRIPWIAGTKDCPFKKKVEEFWEQKGITPETKILAKDSSQKELVGQGLGIGFLEPQDALALIDSGLAELHLRYLVEIPLSVVYLEKVYTPIIEWLCTYVVGRYDTLELGKERAPHFPPQPSVQAVS
ncbi:MAG: LysR family transcriptional regulator substrate-binding protein [Pseudomonadota bacterium]